MSAEVIVLERCGSTQSAVEELLRTRPAQVLAVQAMSQQAGRGRAGRRWEDPPGTALLLSVGTRLALPAARLSGLPRLVGQELHDALCDAVGAPAELLAWRAPNDLVAAGGEAAGAKLAGVLIDSTTTGGTVDRVVVGIGANITGGSFRTLDGARATSLQALCEAPPVDVRALAQQVANRVAALLLGAVSPLGR